MVKSDYHRLDGHKQAKLRRGSRTNIRRNSSKGKAINSKRWLKARRRLSKDLLGG